MTARNLALVAAALAAVAFLYAPELAAARQVETAAALRDSAAASPTTLTVKASGALPGFRVAELPAFLAAQMNAARLGGWHFQPGGGDVAVPDRVEWKFAPNPFAGGASRTIAPTPMAEKLFGARRLITIEARLYLEGDYQTIVFGQATIQGGSGDRNLTATISRLTEALLGPSGAYRSIDIKGPRRREGTPR